MTSRKYTISRKVLENRFAKKKAIISKLKSELRDIQFQIYKLNDKQTQYTEEVQNTGDVFGILHWKETFNTDQEPLLIDRQRIVCVNGRLI